MHTLRPRIHCRARRRKLEKKSRTSEGNKRPFNIEQDGDKLGMEFQGGARRGSVHPGVLLAWDSSISDDVGRTDIHRDTKAIESHTASWQKTPRLDPKVRRINAPWTFLSALSVPFVGCFSTNGLLLRSLQRLQVRYDRCSCCRTYNLKGSVLLEYIKLWQPFPI